MKKIFSILICSALFAQGAIAQGALDLLTYSRYFSGGTARATAMSGAFGALGGDMSVLSTNPAGIGIYRGTEFTLTLGPSFVTTSSKLNGENFDEAASFFRLNNIGYVHTWKPQSERKLRSFTFGFAYNRLSDFSSAAFVDTDVPSSLVEDLTWDANHGDNGQPLQEGRLDDFYTGPAFDTKLIFHDPDNSSDNHYYNDYSSEGNYLQPMKRTMTNKGGVGEYAISLGFNINDRMYLGATWGIQSLYHKESYLHTETPSFQYLDEFQFRSDYTVTGTGMNFKTGVIFRPINMLRLAVSIHTPTRYSLRSELDTEMDAYYKEPIITSDNANHYNSLSPIGEGKFKLSTPWRYSAGAAFIIGTFGIIGLDAEYVDYATAKFRPNSDYRNINREAAQIFRNALNLKGGAEFRIGPVSLRGGAAYYGTPFAQEHFSSDEFDNEGIISFSGGVGIRGRGVYLDMSYVYTKYPPHYYDLYRQNPANNAWLSSVMQEKKHAVNFTVGLKF
ncbi:MAG: hypothetical protein LBS03_07390 [Bacteroidales bacterium]|jgi:hypothetical protein|nr:hypothetical protein [Bacteroidales bacterium]